MDVAIESSWKEALSTELSAPYFIQLSKRVRDAYLEKNPVYPPQKAVFTAFELCPFNEVRVVILGQDPYHGKGQAHGLCFSVPFDIRIPPSLINIYKELKTDLGTPVATSGNLERWATQGVLLLNATLTVEADKPGSHHGLGWEKFTDAVIKKLSEEKEHVVFLLWGKYAQDKGAHIDSTRHLILRATHPSPFSAHSGFFGCRHFSKTNAYLEAHSKTPIRW
jgi:uracil-DNA glycosylase